MSMKSMDDQVWSALIGPAHTPSGAALLLGVTLGDLETRPLLRLVQANGRPCYPAAQFDGAEPVRGLEQLIATMLDGAVSPWMQASILFGRRAEWGGRTAIDRLWRGHLQDLEEVTVFVRRVVGDLNR
jgi:hypothetical protein